MSLRRIFEISRKVYKDAFGEKRVDKHEVEYRLSPKPFRLLMRHELPSSYDEDDTTSDGVWFRKDRQIYNLNEFVTVGMPVIPGPHGGAQLASNGYFAIASFEGKVYGVTIQDSKTAGYNEPDSWGINKGPIINTNVWI